MFHGPIVAAKEVAAAEKTAGGPIAGIALALPFSLAMWAILIGVVRLWF
jgi:hypothetical protein